MRGDGAVDRWSILEEAEVRLVWGGGFGLGLSNGTVLQDYDVEG